MAHGRFITRFDEEHSRPVVVLGAAVADSLFGPIDPIGKVVQMNGREYEVIGIFEKDPGMFGGPGVDQFVVMPFTLFRKQYPESKELILAFSIAKGVNPDAPEDEVTDAMRRLRHVRYNQENDFEMTSPDFLSNLWNQLTGALVILTSHHQFCRAAGGRHRRDEHHVDLGDGADQTRSAFVRRSAQEVGYPRAIPARGGRADGYRWHHRDLLGGAFAFVRTLMPSIPACVSVLGHARCHNVGRCRAILRVLSRQSRRESRPDCLPPVRMTRTRSNGNFATTSHHRRTHPHYGRAECDARFVLRRRNYSILTAAAHALELEAARRRHHRHRG